MNIINKTFIKIIAKKLSKKWFNTKGGDDVMDKKPWYKSKTIIAGVVTVIITVYNAVLPVLSTEFGITLNPIPEFVYVLLGGLGVYGRKTAHTEIK